MAHINGDTYRKESIVEGRPLTSFARGSREGGDEGGGGQVAFLRSMKLRRLRLVPGARVICIGMHRAARWPKLTTWNDLQGVLMNVRSCHGPRAV